MGAPRPHQTKRPYFFRNTTDLDITVMTASRESDWLSAPGPYQNLIATLCEADPRLRSKCETNIPRRIPWPNPRAKLVVLSGDSNMVFGEPVPYDPRPLNAFLETQRDNQPNTTAWGRVFILQGIHPDFIAVLGEHLKMDPSFFLEHERFITSSMDIHQVSDTPALPGTARMRQHYTMKYYELVGLPKNAQGEFGVCCAVTGRHIGVSRVKGKFSDVGIMRRKCSIWRQTRPSGHGWDCELHTLFQRALTGRQLTRANKASYSRIRHCERPRCCVVPCTRRSLCHRCCTRTAISISCLLPFRWTLAPGHLEPQC